MELSKTYDPKRAEDRWYAVWEERGYLHAEVDPGKEPFSIAIPPPNVTGELHMGHALNNTLQDIVIRYQRANGKSACWFPGMDHASIAVHTLVERALRERTLDDLLEKVGFDPAAHPGPLTRHDLGRETFLKLCWAWKARFGGRIRQQLRVLGCSCDWARERFTLDEGLSHAVTTAFVRLYEAGLIYRDTKLVNWDVEAKTVLSDLEVETEEGVQGELFEFAYPLKGGGEVVVATTRPETMLGDTALAVHPDDARHQRLLGKHAKHPILDRLVPIIGDAELVDPAFGTGVVKVTPAHDFNDFAMGRRHGLEVISVLNPDGTANDNAGPYSGLERFALRDAVKARLEELGLVRGAKPHLMTLPRSQRTGTVVEPMISTQWFVQMTPLAQPAIEAVRDGAIRFIPEEWTKTYDHWMENIQDWCISRQLWWGHRIPVWYKIDADRNDPANWQVGTPPADPDNWVQDEDVLDTWFSSGLWPFSIMGWPEQTPEQDYFYPTSYLSTGPDIIFFWVARMIMSGLYFKGKIPFETVFFHPMVVDEQGKKMSKTKGNVLDPLALKDDYGIDALRFTLVSGTSKGKDLRLSLTSVDSSRKFLNKIWNAARFVLGNLEGFEGSGLPPKRRLALEDRWVLTRLQRAVVEVRRCLDRYDFNLAASAVYVFIWRDFCDWYLEWVKPRLYGSDGAQRAVVQSVLQHVLRDIVKLLHPFTPFIAEELWQHLPLRDGESVMVAPFPTASDDLDDDDALAKMDGLQALIVAVRTMRSEINIPPDKKAPAMIRTESVELIEIVEAYRETFSSLAHVSELQIGPNVVRPAQAPRKVLELAEVFLPLEGVIDIAAERVRLVQELAKVEQDLKRTLNKLENEDFLKKAPGDVVDKEEQKKSEFQQRQQRLEQNLALLGVKT